MTDFRTPWWNTCSAFMKPEFSPQHQGITISKQKDNFNLKLYLFFLINDILRSSTLQYKFNIFSCMLLLSSKESWIIWFIVGGISLPEFRSTGTAGVRVGVMPEAGGFS